MEGRARDATTTAAGGEPRVLAVDRLVASVSTEQLIESIAVHPRREGVEQLVGCRRAGQVRAAFNDILPGERSAGSPLHLLIDDLPGASLVSSWAWSRWCGDGPPPMYRPTVIELHSLDERLKSMEGVCVGHRVGARVSGDLGSGRDATRQVVVLPHPLDPRGWHDLPDITGPSMRRARRIDVWLAGVLHVEGMFQDSGTTPSGERQAIHEYSFRATVDPRSLVLLSVEACPHVLPFPECPEAVANLSRLVGSPVSEFRRIVLEQLRREQGCTHLNDAMRGIADVPSMARRLIDGTL